MGTWRRLECLWKHSECATGNKLQVWDAVIKSKLFYGLEAANYQAIIELMETFPLKGLRQILKITTTYVDRAHTDADVYAKAAEALAALRGARGGRHRGR